MIPTAKLIYHMNSHGNLYPLFKIIKKGLHSTEVKARRNNDEDVGNDRNGEVFGPN